MMDVLCNVMAGLVHYFALTSLAWTVVESIAMCFDYKYKLDGRGKTFFIAGSLIAWCK